MASVDELALANKRERKAAEKQARLTSKKAES